jgi:uncharacterized DUF497 family protein
MTLGLSDQGLLVVHHTFTTTDESQVVIRLISSRKATRHEIQQYAERSP